jgi:hypothetical protein
MGHGCLEVGRGWILAGPNPSQLESLFFRGLFPAEVNPRPSCSVLAPQTSTDFADDPTVRLRSVSSLDLKRVVFQTANVIIFVVQLHNSLCLFSALEQRYVQSNRIKRAISGIR